MMMEYFRGVIAPFCAALFFVSLAPAAIAAGLVTGSGNPGHMVGRLWARLSLWVAGIDVEVEGRENIPEEKSAVYACNHASQFDIPILYQALPIQFRFLVKQELFRVPLLGVAMKRSGYIPVDRTGGKAAMRSLMEAASRVREGTSIVIFPEGTRSPDGRLRPFKVGAMLLAIKVGCPIVPVAISGSHRILPKGSLRVRPGRKVKVRIGPPIQAPGSMRQMSKNVVTEEVWDAVRSMLDPGNRPD